MKATTSIVIADDHALVREAVSFRLEAEEDLRVVARCPDAESARVMCVDMEPDVLLIDVSMPGLNSFDAVRSMRGGGCDTRVIFVAGVLQDRHIGSAAAVRAEGFVTKCEPLDRVISAVRSVAAGQSYFSPRVSERLLRRQSGADVELELKARVTALTEREMQILTYIARGFSKKEIAGIMHLSVKTVDNHSTRLMGKLNIHDRVHLARFALREGLAELDV